MTQEENHPIAEPTLSGSELLVSVDEYKLVHGFAGWYEPPSWEFKDAVISWNELMPVVEKIEETTDTALNIFLKECWLADEEYRRTAKGKRIATKGRTKIEAVWLAVVEYIKWYNSTIKVNS